MFQASSLPIFVEIGRGRDFFPVIGGGSFGGGSLGGPVGEVFRSV